MNKVLFIAMNLNSGGAERQMVTIAKALKTIGHDVSFVCYAEGEFFLEELKQADIKVSFLLKKSALLRLWTFRRYIRNGHYDVVISFLETANILNCFAAMGGHSWRIITGERSSRKENLLSRRGRIVAALIKSYADALVCNSDNAARMWNSIYPNLSDKLRVIYNTTAIDEHLGKVGPNRNFIKVVVAASYRKEKNLLNVVKAVSMLSVTDRNKLKIEWYGASDFEGSNYEQCKNEIVMNELQDTIVLQSQTSKIFDLMASADYVGLFSLYEGLPNVICEAMCLGKPVIMTPVSDYDKLVDGNGYLSEGFEASSIRDVLLKILNTPVETLEQMGRQSKEIASHLFSESIVIDKWLKEIV